MDHQQIDIYNENMLFNQSLQGLKKKFKLKYNCQVEQLSQNLQSKWLELEFCKQTQRLLQEWIQNPYGIVWIKLKAIFIKIFGRYDGGGYLNMMQMHVLSTLHWQKLLSRETQVGSLLDVGAGDGGDTLRASPLFEDVTATEISFPLQWRIKQKGIKCIKTMSLTDSGLCNQSFDVVSCFNVLDRCDDPWKLMEELKSCCKPNGLIVLAIVIPFCPVVISSSVKKDPTNTFKGIPGCNDKKPHRFERCINAFDEKVFNKLGLEIISVSRVPYMSHGDFKYELFTLDNAIFVLKAR